MSDCAKKKPFIEGYKLHMTGSDLSTLIDKLSQLGLASASMDGLMSASDKSKLDRITNELHSFVNRYESNLANYYSKKDTYTRDEVQHIVDKVADDILEIIEEIRGGAEAGATAIQEETDPTVPDWAKRPNKPTYTADEIGALPIGTKIPDSLSDLSDDAEHRTVTDAEKTDWNGKYVKPSSGIPASDIASGVIPATQVPADWDATTGVARILNKPTIPAAPVNADWNADSGLAQILNKPTIPTQYAGSPTAGGFANKAVAIPFGQVDAGSTATEITATVDNFPETLTDGVCAFIRNNVVASASGWTLNINGTGAKPVYASNAAATRTTTIFTAAVTYLFIYNSTRVEGGCWDMYYGYNSNDNTIGYNLRTNAMSLPTTSACYRYRLLFTSADHTHFVPANASSSTNATAKRTTTQTPIDPFGSIRYYSYTTAVTSGNRPGTSYLWEQYSVTLGYSFNRTGAALTLTAWKPVYIKCTPQTDGSAIIDAEEPYVQELPTTADGEIYIHLGVATSATQVEMVFHHPVYYIDANGRKRIWTGEDISI